MAHPKRARFTQTGFLAMSRMAWGAEYESRPAPEPFETVGQVAIVDVVGPLLNREDPWGCWDSYDAIGSRARAAFESSARTVVLRVDSPGGDAAGCMELARELRAMARDSGKRLITYVDGCCASAAYAIGCAADEMYAPPTSSVGSIGVFEAMVDTTAMDRMMGLAFAFVSSGKRKLDGNPHAPIGEDAIAAKQVKVDLLAGLFFDLVAEMRATSPAGVKALEGELLLSEQAFQNGLIDEVAVWPALLERLESSTETPDMPIPNKAQAKASDEEWKALRTLSESSDPEKQKMAKKMLATMTGGGESAEGEGGESDEDKKKQNEEAKAKADEEAKAKAAADEKKDEEAKALAANGLAMATQIAELNARLSARDQADAKAKAEADLQGLFAKRPDLSDAQRKALAAVPFEQAKALVDSWPRVTAGAGAAVHAMTPGATGGERQVAAADVHLTPEQTAILARVQGNPAGAQSSVQQGNEFFVPIYDPAAIAARIESRKGNV